MFFRYVYKEFARLYDRSFTFNHRQTRKAGQEDYEDLYTGPRPILQIRYAQTLSVVFLVMTFSAGLPILYLAAVIHFFFTYWIDKFLLLRYYRLTTSYTRFLSKNVNSIMPLAVPLHCLFNMVMISDPMVLRSEHINKFFLGNDS